MKLEQFFFWKTKTPSDNDWRPRPGKDSLESHYNLPQWFRRMDVDAMVVDVAPFICGVGGLTHMRQLNSLGWTVPASVFRNPRTMMAMHNTAWFLPAVVLLCQATGIEYRNFIPRWSHDRERRRNDQEVREHIQYGLLGGMGIWFTRLYILRVGRAYRNPLLEMTMSGALTDLMDREYRKAHGF